VRLDAQDPRALADAAQRLAAGQLVAFPTETVYGLGARADDDDAVRRSLALLIGTVGLSVAEWPHPQAFLEGFDRESIGAIVLDVRAGDVPLAFGAMRGALEGRGIRPVIIFLEARDDVLIRRFSETRHRHPLADERKALADRAADDAVDRMLLAADR